MSPVQIEDTTKPKWSKRFAQFALTIRQNLTLLLFSDMSYHVHINDTVQTFYQLNLEY